MKPIIKVENLSKRYKIGGRQKPYQTLRESLIETAQKPFKALRRAQKENGENTFWALRDISFEIRPGEVVGIIGRNGAGKSTLLKILSRITEPTEGRIELYGRVGSLLEVGTGFHHELTGRENIFLNGSILGMRREEIAKKFDEIVDFAEIGKFIDTPVKHYSSGMYVKLAFSVAAYLDSEILVVDEVLAVGDIAFQNKCLGKMEDISSNFGRTVIVVSHNMGIVEKLCDRAILLQNGKTVPTRNMKEAVQLYLGDNSANTIIFDDGPLKTASIRQVEQKIELTVEYDTDRSLEMPCLGFVIYDYRGNAICGCNPKMSLGMNENVLIRRKSGTVIAEINQPKLLNGTYRVSLWFGDGKQDFFNAMFCLTFEVVNMGNWAWLPEVTDYNVFPECEWQFK